MSTPQSNLITTVPAILGVVLTRRREELGLKQLNIANHVQVSQPYWSQVESGRAVLSVVQLWRAAEILQVNPGWLLEQTAQFRMRLLAQGVQVSTEPNPNISEGLKLAGTVLLGGLLVAALLAK